ncbi:hypothetical protein AYK24_00470 [Thermoplasmatales archaeon SG8-52-4]|nr:MAG: hypothetical protein AYK24_00470 [Thermoplasmatales archaeon SG8-52-4]
MIDLSTPLGTYSKKGTVEEIQIETVNIPMEENEPPKQRDKICLMIKREDGKIIRVNEVFVQDYKGTKKQRGLWVSTDASGSVNYFSTLGKFMRKYGKTTIQDLVGLEIDLFVGEKDLLVGSAD